MDKNCTDRPFFYSEIPKKFGLNSLSRSKVIELFIFIKFTRHLTEVRQVVHYTVLDGKHVKNRTISLKFCTLIISAFRNNVAKLHLHSLHRSGEINNNVLKF
jgi:hypothetical protein